MFESLHWIENANDNKTNNLTTKQCHVNKLTHAVRISLSTRSTRSIFLVHIKNIVFTVHIPPCKVRNNGVVAIPPFSDIIPKMNLAHQQKANHEAVV